MITYRLIGKANRVHRRYRFGERVTFIFTTELPISLDEYRARCEVMGNESINWIDVESWEVEQGADNA